MLCSYRTFPPPLFFKRNIFQGFLQFTLEALLLTNVDVKLFQFPFACLSCIAVLSQKKKQYMYLFNLFFILFMVIIIFFFFLNNHFVVCRPKGVDALGCTDIMRFLFLMHYFFWGEIVFKRRRKNKTLSRSA